MGCEEASQLAACHAKYSWNGKRTPRSLTMPLCPPCPCQSERLTAGHRCPINRRRVQEQARWSYLQRWEWSQTARGRCLRCGRYRSSASRPLPCSDSSLGKGCLDRPCALLLGFGTQGCTDESSMHGTHRPQLAQRFPLNSVRFELSTRPSSALQSETCTEQGQDTLCCRMAVIVQECLHISLSSNRRNNRAQAAPILARLGAL